jgi:hypothetical protein
MKNLVLSLFSMLVLLSASSETKADHHLEDPLQESSLIPGSWVRSQILAQGGVLTWTKEIVADKEPNTFIETITTSDQDGLIQELWKLKFQVTRANGPTLVFRSTHQNSYNQEDEKWSGWRENKNVSYTFQINEAFWYEFRDLTDQNGLFTFSRVDSGNERSYQKVAARKLAILSPKIGVFKGSVKQSADNEAYGLKAGVKRRITYTSKWNSDKTLLTGVWADDAGFDVKVIHSFNPLKRAIVKNYHTSTGAQITGQLLAAWGNVFLWERSGDTARGRLYEKGVFDYSEEGVLVHRILERTLNGVPQPQEADIILKKVSDGSF